MKMLRKRSENQQVHWDSRGRKNMATIKVDSTAMRDKAQHLKILHQILAHIQIDWNRKLME